MWGKHSFSNASRQIFNYDSMDDISSDSSRGASPSSDDTNRRSLHASCSIAELSQQFDKHTLEPRRRPSYFRAPPSESYDLRSTTGRGRPASAHNHHTIRRRRESMVRRQCSAANMLRLSSLVQDLLQDGASSCDTHTHSLDDGDTLPPLQSYGGPPLRSPTSSSMSTSSCSEDGEFELHSSSQSQSKFKVGKELKPSVSGETVGRQYKDIRMRKSTRRRSATLSSRHE